jgi:hypothetical protein
MPADATADPPQPRRRGGQPGNTNALRHGFYARASLTLHTRELLGHASEATLQDDIDMLRVEIARLIERGDYDPQHLAALSRALTAAVTAEAKLSKPQADALGSAVENVLRDVLEATR